ncbi:MAG: zinc-finger domain-containing protein [Pseudomonadota bacterium]
MHSEIVKVETSQIFCEGNGKTHGHPRIFLKLNEDRKVVCPYCSCVFVQELEES